MLGGCMWDSLGCILDVDVEVDIILFGSCFWSFFVEFWNLMESGSVMLLVFSSFFSYILLW